MNKLRIGDKIRWNVSIGGNTIYTILDIDTTRPLKWITDIIFTREEILFEYEKGGEIVTSWGHSYEDLNNNLNAGGIIIVERDCKPVKQITKLDICI